MHEPGFDHEHDVGITYTDQKAIEQAILEQDTLELLTVGIDIGSSTSHLLFSKVLLQREANNLSSRFVVVDRRVVWSSSILLTPFLSNGTIDADELAHFVHRCYSEAGFDKSNVDSGAVILTGEAIKAKNARAIDQIFANESGKFVCATAGHKLECILAAHGSGATALSRKRDVCALHADIGGGTTKLALIDKGEIISVAAFAVGGRLIAQDQDGLWTRVNASAEVVAKELGLSTSSHALADAATRNAIAKRLSELVVDQIVGVQLDDLGRSLELTDPLVRSAQPQYITFSGGVAEYIFGHETQEYGDIAVALSRGIIDQLSSRISIPCIDVDRRIRATVIGVSQFTIQVSGKTIYIKGEDPLPIQNLPIVHLGQLLPEHIDPNSIAEAFLQRAERQDLDLADVSALAFTWTGSPTYERLAAMAQVVMKVSIAGSAADSDPMVLLIDGDVGQSIGQILDKELGLRRDLISIDGVELKDLDFVDIGELLDPPGVIPLVIKSLLF